MPGALIRALLLTLVAVAGPSWIAPGSTRASMRRVHAGWLAAVFGASIAGAVASRLAHHPLGNFYLHLLAGGAATAFAYEHLRWSVGVKTGLRLDAVLLFAFASSMGVLNELGEYLVDSAGWRTFSADRADTWRDLTANTLGAVAAWGAVRAAGAVRRVTATEPG